MKPTWQRLALVSFAVLLGGCLGPRARTTPARALVLSGAKIYPAPGERPIEGGVIVVHEGKILAAGSAGSVELPAAPDLLDCSGLVIAAGFQNSHVHFSESRCPSSQTRWRFVVGSSQAWPARES